MKWFAHVHIANLRAMSPDQIGTASVKFETSCAPAVKDDFNKAVALLHAFEATMKKEPNLSFSRRGDSLGKAGRRVGPVR